MPKRGRPKKRAADSRVYKIQVRITPEERRRIRKEAEARGVTMGDLLRKAVGLPIVNAGPAGNPAGSSR